MKLYRSDSDRTIAGVCGGIAENLGWSSSRLRIVWVLATILTAFAGALVYLALWYLMPAEPPKYKAALLQPWKTGLSTEKK